MLKFEPNFEAKKEYALLTKTLGRGESACMVYCRFNHNVLASSNLKDIREYCRDNKITYLTTIDFLYYAIQKQIISIEEADSFISKVKQNDSKLPDIDFKIFVSSVLI